MIWFHEKVLRHTVRRRQVVTAPPWDAHAKGLLVTCACGKTWAR